jgi:hypothetical protein
MNRYPTRVACTIALTLAMAATAGAQSQDPDLPQVFLDTTYPTQTGATINVAAGGNLQAAIDAALPGDTIRLAAGATFTGTFVLPLKSNPQNLWIVIRSASSTFDTGGAVPAGTRVDGRNSAHTAQMPKILSNATNGPAFRTAASAHHYRLVGLEIGTITSVTQNTQTVALGEGEATLAQLPTDIVIDRCFIHGNTTGNYRRGVAMNGIRQSVIDSYFTEFHDANTDAQGIAGWHGPGPFKIVNNHIEATDENIMFGGSGPSINGVVPSDIEIRRNVSTKPLAWNGVHRVKNAFELKAGRRVLVEGNIFENVWVSGQDGTAILLKSTNPPNDSCTWCVTEHVTFRHNIVRNATHGFKVHSRERGSGSVVNPPDANHIKVENVLFENITGGRLFIIMKNVAHFQVVHVTAQSPWWILMPETAATDSHPSTTFRDSIVERNSYGVGTGADEGTVTLNRNFSPYYWNQNVFANNSGSSNTTIANRYPTGTHVVTGFDGVGFVDWRNGNWRLSSTSPFKGAATDGKDIGVDFDALECAMDPANCDPAVLLEDDFNDNLIDSSKWSIGVWSGTTQDTTIPVSEVNARLEVGPLRANTSGAHYNALRSNSTRDFTGASAYVQLVQPASQAVVTYSMFSVGRNADNYYRWYVVSGTLVAQKEIAGVKTTLLSVPYNSAAHQFLRIRHDSATGHVVFETAPNSSGAPGTWTIGYSETWNVTAVPLVTMLFEMKGGTDAAVASPGTVVWDNFRAVRD